MLVERWRWTLHEPNSRFETLQERLPRIFSHKGLI